MTIVAGGARYGATDSHGKIPDVVLAKIRPAAEEAIRLKTRGPRGSVYIRPALFSYNYSLDAEADEDRASHVIITQGDNNGTKSPYAVFVKLNEQRRNAEIVRIERLNLGNFQ